MTTTITAIPTTGVNVTLWDIEPVTYDRRVFYAVIGPLGNFVDAGVIAIFAKDTALQHVVVTGGPLYTPGTYKLVVYVGSNDPTVPPTPYSATFNYP